MDLLLAGIRVGVALCSPEPPFFGTRSTEEDSKGTSPVLERIELPRDLLAIELIELFTSWIGSVAFMPAA